jgi:hypothetical protein
MAKKPASKSKKLKRQSRFSSRQLSIFVLIFAVVGGIVIWRSLAAPHSGGGNKTSVPPISLTRDYVQNSPNPSAPTDCMNEDDYHERDYSGSLNGSFTADEQYCNQEFFSSGGEGLRAEAWVVGNLADMTITSPTGVAHHAVLIDSSTYKHVTTYHYQTCFATHYYVSSNTADASLSLLYPGNPWVYTLSGNLAQASYHIYSHMLNANYQKTYCPPSEQNLSP